MQVKATKVNSYTHQYRENTTTLFLAKSYATNQLARPVVTQREEARLS